MIVVDLLQKQNTCNTKLQLADIAPFTSTVIKQTKPKDFSGILEGSNLTPSPVELLTRATGTVVLLYYSKMCDAACINLCL